MMKKIVLAAAVFGAAVGYAHIAPLTAGFLRKNTDCAHSKMSGK